MEGGGSKGLVAILLFCYLCPGFQVLVKDPTCLPRRGMYGNSQGGFLRARLLRGQFLGWRARLAALQ